MLWRKTDSEYAFKKLERFDRVVMTTELLLLAALLVLAGKHAAALITPLFLVLFWGGVVALGIVYPLWANRSDTNHRIQPGDLILTSALALIGGALLRICMLQAGQL
jgi:formate-dependent nitrite reductase membrane component NrfD